MDIKRIKELAGMKTVKNDKKVVTAVTAEFRAIKLSEEVDFKHLARVHGAEVSIKEVKGSSIGVVTFNEDSTNASNEKLATFRTAWKDRNKAAVVVEAVEPITESPIEDEVVAVIEPVEPVVEEVVEVEEVLEPVDAEAVVEDSNNFFLKHSETKPMPIMGLQDPNDLNDRMGINKERADKVEVPSDVKSAVSARIAELKKSIAEYDDKGFNDVSQKEKAIECLEKIMEHLAQGNSEGLKHAQIFFGTLMSPITECFPAKLITFLGNADARKAGWLDRFKVAEGVGYGERRGMLRDRIGRDDMASELSAMGTEDDSTDISTDSLNGNDHEQSGQSDGDDDWQSSHDGCSFGDEAEYEYTMPCPKCGKENSVTPAHMEFAPDPACVDCMGPAAELNSEM